MHSSYRYGVCIVFNRTGIFTFRFFVSDYGLFLICRLFLRRLGLGLPVNSGVFFDISINMHRRREKGKICFDHIGVGGEGGRSSNTHGDVTRLSAVDFFLCARSSYSIVFLLLANMKHHSIFFPK